MICCLKRMRALYRAGIADLSSPQMRLPLSPSLCPRYRLVEAKSAIAWNAITDCCCCSLQPRSPLPQARMGIGIRYAEDMPMSCEDTALHHQVSCSGAASGLHPFLSPSLPPLRVGTDCTSITSKLLMAALMAACNGLHEDGHLSLSLSLSLFSPAARRVRRWGSATPRRPRRLPKSLAWP